MVKIAPDEFRSLSKYIYDISGISLDASKIYLVESRLSSLLKELECSTFSEFYFKILADRAKKLQSKVIDAVTTNETFFFRDTSFFELVQHKILPDLIDKRSTRTGPGHPVNIRIWSAACSTGQEVYTIAMILKDLLVDMNKYNIKLLGTDISDSAVAKASYGLYNKFEIERGLPKDKLMKYLVAEKDLWKIRDELRAMASFRKMNLFENFNGIGKFDIIFCRNVAIYFTEEDRARLFSKIGEALEPDGYLIIGSTESLTGICPQFEPKRYLRAVFYQKKNGISSL